MNYYSVITAKESIREKGVLLPLPGLEWETEGAEVLGVIIFGGEEALNPVALLGISFWDILVLGSFMLLGGAEKLEDFTGIWLTLAKVLGPAW